MKPSVVLSGAASVLCLYLAVAALGWSTPWLLIGAGGFALEAFALNRKAKGDTLSETIWKLPLWGRILIGMFFLWLAAHFVFGI